ncbi:MAG: nucleoside hydrolase [Acidimicrobiales bacterium]
MPEPRPAARPLIVDTDGGVDDAAALWWALGDPRVDVVAISIVWGNVDLGVAAGAVLRVLAAAGRTDIPVALGEAGPIGPAPDLRPATFIHGDDGLGNARYPLAEGIVAVDEPAADLLRRLVHARPGEISLVTIGPLSTIGRLVSDDSTFAADIDELVVMGGSARKGGNALPAGEANVAHDPVGAHNVVNAAWRKPPLLVGLDVTHQATLTEAEFALLAEHRSPAASFLDQPLRFYREFGSTMTAPDCPCHDLLAVMALVEPDVIPDAPVLPLGVDCGEGAAWGSTVVDFRAPFFDELDGADQSRPEGFADWRIALVADAESFRASTRALFGG